MDVNPILTMILSRISGLKVPHPVCREHTPYAGFPSWQRLRPSIRFRPMRLNTQMRIISGTAKGSPIMCVPGDAVRPTPERMRGAVFNILGPEVVDANVLDLFAGTGSLGLESLSRGPVAACLSRWGLALCRLCERISTHSVLMTERT